MPGYSRSRATKTIPEVESLAEVRTSLQEVLFAAWNMETAERQLLRVAFHLRFVGFYNGVSETQKWTAIMSSFTYDGLLLQVNAYLDGIAQALLTQVFDTDYHIYCGVTAILEYDTESVPEPPVSDTVERDPK